MLAQAETTIHASCVLVGRGAVLIRGPSGSGKSRLAAALIEAHGPASAPLTRLVADDRVRVFAANGRLLAAAPEAIAGLIEIRGLGIRTLAHEPLAVVALVADLAAADAGRMPEDAARETELLGVKLPRLPVAAGEDAVPAVLAAIRALTEA